MASVTLRQKVLTTTHPYEQPRLNDYNFLNQGAAAGGQTSSTSIDAGAGTVVTDVAAMIISLGTTIPALVTTALGHAGASFNSTADITAIQTAVTAGLALVNTGSTDAAALKVLTAANASVAGANIVLSFDTTSVTTRTQLFKALDAFRDQIRSGYGGLAE